MTTFSKRAFFGLCVLLVLLISSVYLSHLNLSVGTDSPALNPDENTSESAPAPQTAGDMLPKHPQSPQSETGEIHQHHAGCNHTLQSEIINDKAGTAVQRPSLDLPEDFLASFDGVEIGGSVSFPLPGGLTARGKLTRKRVDSYGYPLSIDGVLEQPGAGRFGFQKEDAPGKAWPLSGIVILEGDTRAYRAEPNPTQPGSAHLVASPIEDVLCYRFPTLPAQFTETPITGAALPADHPTNIPIPDYQNGVIPLQSLPGVTAVLYLDFDGEEGPHERWGDFDALPATDLSVANIFGIWRRVAEDYAPFNLNVTTDLQVYLDAPENSRQRIIVTPTSTALPGSGGGGGCFCRFIQLERQRPCLGFLLQWKRCRRSHLA